MWWVNQDLELQEWEDFIKSNKIKILAIIMLFPINNPQGYKENVISFIELSFGEGFTTIDLIENMKLYVSDIEESYKNTIIGNMGSSGTVDSLLHIVQCWRACAVNEENQALHLVLYFSHTMYKYYSRIGFPPIK